MIRCSAPLRIDLSGGTLDIYPIYLFEGGCFTLNAAISLRSEVLLKDAPFITIEAADLGRKVEAKNLKELPLIPELDLIIRAVKFFNPPRNFYLKTAIQAPKGAGLGGSSALLMALFNALGEFCPKKMTPATMIKVGAQLEALSIGTLTGKQDYFSAIFGGISAIKFSLGKEKRKELALSSAFKKLLADCLILTFSGASHFSARENWNMIKAYLDANPNTRKRMSIIKDCARQMKKALETENLEKAGAILAQEWQARRGLAQGVETPRLKALISAAQKAGALGSKVCGAGGGGCLITLCPPSPENKTRILNALKKQGGEILPFALDFKGLELSA